MANEDLPLKLEILCAFVTHTPWATGKIYEEDETKLVPNDT
jgi:hypothetical protein